MEIPRLKLGSRTDNELVADRTTSLLATILVGDVWGMPIPVKGIQLRLGSSYVFGARFKRVCFLDWGIISADSSRRTDVVLGEDVLDLKPCIELGICGMIHSITRHYHPCEPAKASQLLDTLHFNLSLGILDSVTLLLEDDADLSVFPEAKTMKIGRRTTFADFLDCVSELAEDDGHAVYANNDIMMSIDIAEAAARLTMNISMIALTRRELDGALPSIENPSWSQDTWIIKTHRISRMLKETVRHSLGIAGCKNIFAAQLVANGCSLWNPSLDVSTIHNDPSRCLTYSRDRRYNEFFAIPLLCHLIDVESAISDYEFTFCAKS
ncbi:hypothetical protein KQ305_08670 [Synechococcus sp. CS-1332]|nr:hypothetical protein [Synechococcus sp. CS-1332]